MTDVSQILPDERPILEEDRIPAYTEHPEKVLKILRLYTSEKSRRWFMSEYFYSFIDRPWY